MWLIRANVYVCLNVFVVLNYRLKYIIAEDFCTGEFQLLRECLGVKNFSTVLSVLKKFW